MSKVRLGLRNLCSRYPPNDKATAIRAALLSTANSARNPSGETVAVQCLEDPFYFGLFGAICQELPTTTAELVVVRSVNSSVGIQWRNRVVRSAVIVSLITSQWVRAFQGIIDRVAYRSVSFAHPLGDLLDWLRSRALWRRQQLSPDFASLRILDVPVGDLIMDSYLRFRPSPRFDGGDRFVHRLIWQVYRDIRRARAYFRHRRPTLYLTSFSTYIEHGVAVRVALQERVRVRSFGSFLSFGKDLSLSDWFHTPNTSDYRTIFRTLDRQQERLDEAEVRLAARLAGAIDVATSYMSVSAYASNASPEEIREVGPAIVVFLHDFYDSPHVYDRLVFDDFWTWTCFTIEVLRQAGRKFYLKPHPNQISLNNEVFRQLLTKYDHLPLLPARISNKQLAEAGIVCGVTVYGTVSHELAFLGVPTIGCAKHPHHAYDFCRTAANPEQYREYLLHAESPPISREEMRRQALEFYYMHNLYGDCDAMALRDSYAEFWKACRGEDSDPTMVVRKFENLRGSPAFKRRVACL